MPDYGQKATDAEFRRLRAKINDVYKQAYKEIEQKGREFAQAHARREAQMRQMVADGKMTQADFDAWMRGQVFQGEQWQKKKQQMADTLYHADQVAQQMVNDSRYNVFAANANYMGYALEHDAGIKTNFGLYDADSVRRLVKKEPDLLPPKKMVGKDKSYQWYNRQVQTAITQGIIQGESLDKIAHRIGKQTGETSMTAMLRNARTMQTGAQNAGRIEGLHQAQELGIKVKKQWMATLDSHTRDAHADLDGQIADVDEPFDSELGPIMYPGDPDADPANVWNCRCTLVYVYPEYPNSMERRDNETGENVGDMTYREWEEMKREQETPEPEQELSPIDRIRDTIANHEGEWSLDEVQEIGRQLSDEVGKNYVDPMERAREINNKQRDLYHEIEAQKARNGELNRLIKETDDKALKKQYRQELAEGRARRKELEGQYSELSKQYWGTFNDDGRSAALQESLAQIRDMGGITEDNVRQYADLQAYPDATGRTMAATIEAMNCYPSSWLEHSQDYWYDLQPHWTTDRAYYNTGTGEIRFNGNKSTNVHEMGHRFEQCVPGILQSEREFYVRRTAGESLEWLGQGYDLSEKARKDKFENAYMGKDYGGHAYELVSMGFQYAFTDYERLAKDPDMETWILGLLATM